MKTNHQKPMINRKPRLPGDTEEESEREQFIKKHGKKYAMGEE